MRVIPEKAFKKCRRLSAVILPQGLESIEQSAFQLCTNLSILEIPESVGSIGDYAFSQCRLLGGLPGKVRISRNTTKLGVSVFGNCRSLIEFEVDDDNPVYRSVDGVLFANDGRLVCYPSGKSDKEYYVPIGTETIDECAFLGARSLRHVRLPGGLRAIGKYAFLKCSALASLRIPETVELIGERAFKSTLKLRVIENSPAHQWAVDNIHRHKVI